MFLIMSYAIGVHHIFLTMSHNDLAVAVCATGLSPWTLFMTKLKSQRDHLRHLVTGLQRFKSFDLNHRFKS